MNLISKQSHYTLKGKQLLQITVINSIWLNSTKNETHYQLSTKFSVS